MSQAAPQFFMEGFFLSPVNHLNVCLLLLCFIKSLASFCGRLHIQLALVLIKRKSGRQPAGQIGPGKQRVLASSMDREGEGDRKEGRKWGRDGNVCQQV